MAGIDGQTSIPDPPPPPQKAEPCLWCGTGTTRRIIVEPQRGSAAMSRTFKAAKTAPCCDECRGGLEKRAREYEEAKKRSPLESSLGVPPKNSGGTTSPPRNSGEAW